VSFQNNTEAQYLPPLDENFSVIERNPHTEDSVTNSKVCHITY